MVRVRVYYSKSAALRYTGHLDLHKVWERTIRRAQLPLAYSQGFHPQPKIQQACPLPLGFTSTCEVVDFWLTEDITADIIRKTLEPALHPGVSIQDLTLCPLSAPPLQTTIRSSTYEIRFQKNENTEGLTEKIDSLISSQNILRERRGKPYDLRPLIHSISFLKEKKPSMVVQLSAMPSATGRPEEVLAELGIDPIDVDVTRTALCFENTDER